MCTMFSSQKIRGSCAVKVLPPPSTWTRCTYFCCSFSSSQSLDSQDLRTWRSCPVIWWRWCPKGIQDQPIYSLWVSVTNYNKSLGCWTSCFMFSESKIKDVYPFAVTSSPGPVTWWWWWPRKFEDQPKCRLWISLANHPTSRIVSQPPILCRWPNTGNNTKYISYWNWGAV